jgi:NitT/TauT family transport system substrate-binding protein
VQIGKEETRRGQTARRKRGGNSVTGFISKYALGAAALALAMCAATGAFAADKLTVIVGGMEKQIYLPAVLTQQLGHFKDEGLDVELLNTRAGVEAENELLAGVVQGVVGFYDHTVDLQSKGKFIQSIVQFSQAPGEVELVSAQHPDIQSPADFKGKTLASRGLVRPPTS